MRENKASVYEGREKRESISLFAINLCYRMDESRMEMKGKTGLRRKGEAKSKDVKGQTRNEKNEE